MAVSAVVAPVGAGATAAAGLAEVFGLNKSASVFFAGDADGLTAGAAASVLAFRVRLAFGEAAGDSAAEAVVAV